MKLQLEVADLVSGAFALEVLLGKELPAVTAWKLARASRPIKAEIASYEEIRVELVRKHGIEDQEGNWQVPPGQNEEFSEELEPLLSQEIELDIPLMTVSDFEGVTVQAGDLAACWFLFEEEYQEVEEVEDATIPDPDPE